MDKNFDFTKYLENSVNAIFTENEELEKVTEDNNKASYMLKQGLHHLKEAYLYMLAVGDKNLGKVAQDIEEAKVKEATDVPKKKIIQILVSFGESNDDRVSAEAVEKLYNNYKE